MSDSSACEVFITGGQVEGTFFTSCDNVKFLGDKLENYGNSSIYLYKTKANTQDSFNPYIIISPYKYPRYYGSRTQSQTIELTSIQKVSYNGLGNFYHYRSFLDTGLIFSVFIIMLLTLLKK